jgi:hypothetical protein
MMVPNKQLTGEESNDQSHMDVGAGLNGGAVSWKGDGHTGYLW